MEVVRNMLTTAAGQRRLPGLIHGAAAGDIGALLSGGGGAPIADGAYLSIVCSEAVPRIPGDSAAFTNGTFLGDYRVRQERAACAQWARYGVADAFYAEPNTGVAILVISGTMDHVTSPEWAREFCAATRGCSLVSIPALGHGPFDLDEWTGGECFDRLAEGFLATPGRVDTACVGRMRPPPFK
jgi:pimeloyl-ACP methyl ester carboxylesterase